MRHDTIDIFKREKKRRRWPVILFILLVISGLSFFGYYKITHLQVADLLNTNFVQKQLESRIPDTYQGTLAVLPTLLGFDSPKTYIVLFNNNTELRPGGGFIGSYATLRLSRGNVSVLALEGTETLDRQTPERWKPTPPSIVAQELGVDRWYFRDSNWDPFFEPNAKRALWFYKKEGGVGGDTLDGVIMIDTTVLEKVLQITGPITVQGNEFTSANIVKTLEYEVEYGYEDRGISFANRKQILRPLFDAILKKIGLSLITHPEQYIELVETLAKEKHLAVYFTDPTVQEKIITVGLGGESIREPGDYLFWVDANLAALKTDHAMERRLSYQIEQTAEGREHIASMTYVHNGTFDWQTTRYRTYARIFVPKGAVLKEIRVIDEYGKESRMAPSAAIVEPYNDLQSFAHFFVVEPGDTKTLSFVYTVPDDIITVDPYQLSIPKQFGTDAHSLTLNLDFGKNITAATPPEAQKYWGNSQYTIVDELQEDKVFQVNF